MNELEFDELGYYGSRDFKPTEGEDIIQPFVKSSLKLNSCELKFIINHTPYAILELEYKNLERLKQDDLLLPNDKGKYLVGCIGLTQEERNLVLNHKDFFEDTMKISINQIAEKEYANLFIGERYKHIQFVLDFDLNHSWHQDKGTQLDKELCFNSIKKGVFAIYQFQALNKEFFKINKEIKHFQGSKDFLLPEARARIPKGMQIDTKLTKIIKAKNTQALENISKFYQAYKGQDYTNTR